MPIFLLHHRHRAEECACRVRRLAGLREPAAPPPGASTCLAGGHEIWWRVEADDERLALALLPRYVAERTTPIAVREVEIP